MNRLIKKLLACKPALFKRAERQVKTPLVISFDGRVVRLYLPEA